MGWGKTGKCTADHVAPLSFEVAHANGGAPTRRANPQKNHVRPPGSDWNLGSFQMTGAARPASAKRGNGSGMSQFLVPARRRRTITVWSGSSSRSGVL